MAFKIKDPVSGLSHLFGVILSIVGLVFLIITSVIKGSVWHTVSYSIFGASLILLYTASSLYHLLPLKQNITMILKRIDHIMIFILIAGTYTPICLVPLRGPWGWSLFGCVWGIALLGLIMKIFWINAPRWFSTVLYVFMGWLIIIALLPLIKVIPPSGMAWLVAGGVFYTIGALIYGIKRPNITRYFGFHELFHFFVLAGSFSHYWLMYRFLILLH
ncbi:hemolysin III family protein [Bacillota bacterium LX-D]|nr:hemolysin III family protein [Bacillota bacterium LX-D]